MSGFSYLKPGTGTAADTKFSGRVYGLDDPTAIRNVCELVDLNVKYGLLICTSCRMFSSRNSRALYSHIKSQHPEKHAAFRDKHGKKPFKDICGDQLNTLSPGKNVYKMDSQFCVLVNTEPGFFFELGR